MFGVSTGELVGCDVLDVIAESDHAAVLTYAGGEGKDCEPIELNACTAVPERQYPSNWHAIASIMKANRQP